MLAIHRYPVIGEGDVTIKMPRGARILSAHVQGSTPCIWAHVDTDRTMEERHFMVLMTGVPVPPAKNYIGTFLLRDGAYVLHLFENK